MTGASQRTKARFKAAVGQANAVPELSVSGSYHAAGITRLRYMTSFDPASIKV